jgi:protein TonB
MRDPFDLLANIAGLTIVGSLVAWFHLAPPSTINGPMIGGVKEVELALEAAPEPPPAPEPQASETQPEPDPQPTPPVEPPPPPPPPEPEPPKEEPPEEVEQEHLLDEEGAPVTPPPQALVQVSEQSASAYKTCLLKRTYYPSTKEARRLKPHGVVGIKILIIEKKIAGIEITQSSGSEILDQAARSSVLNSRCEAKGELFGIIIAAIRF